MEANEKQLVKLAKAGDTKAFGSLVELHQRYVYNLALRVVANPQEAEDLAQEALVRAWIALPNFREQAQFRTWLYRIVANLCFNRLPGLRRELNDLGDEYLEDWSDLNAAQDDPAAITEANDLKDFLYYEIDKLPEQYRLLVSLRYQQELSYDEISSVLNLPLGTVKTGLFRAKERLRSTLAAKANVLEEIVV
ncbi:MAG: sigma-70 family RNA polymerase sigma factor [Anaerolineales bacterium]|nr:sigma-70 family RNA polymerase sigma factor [Anaerolineales bacterium]